MDHGSAPAKPKHLCLRDVLLTEDACILGVEAEDDPDAELVQALQRLRRVGIFVLLQKSVVKNTHKLTCLQGNLHFPFDLLVARVNQELQPDIFFFQVGKFDNFRGIVGPIHIMDMKLLEVTDNDPTRILIVWLITRIATGQLEWGEKGAVRLFVPLFKVDVQTFLFNRYRARILPPL